MNCPCCSGLTFDRCCERFISHRELPENAQQLMRSRYCAYALAEVDYLRESWLPAARPPRLEIDSRIRWLGLDILADDPQGDIATVEFEARYLLAGRVEAMHERSRFQRRQGRWFYVDGEMLAPGFRAWKPARNESCPCGSGEKFKRCCACR